MTEKPIRTLTFGAVGWNDTQVVDGLYPEDVPYAWRLPCYASHFDTVLVPEADWQEATPEEVARWGEELPSQFWFYLLAERAPDEAHLAQLAAVSRGLGERLGGIVLDGEAAGAGVSRAAGVPGVALFSARAAAGPGRLWTGPQSPCPCGHAGLVRFDAHPSPRALRETLEAFLACQQESWSVLFMRAPVGTFDDARVVGRLLGVT
jgi:hypothetical protein